MRYLLALWTGKLSILLLRWSGRGGSALPGLIALRIDRRFLSRAAHQLDGSVIVTGTNGKTTTAKVLEQILTDQGWQVLRNRAGSNMSRGVASSVIENSNLLGQLRPKWAVLEVDEAYASEIAQIFRPAAIVVLNLLRDQLDRYGELDTIARQLGKALKDTKTAVLNGDDPLVAGLVSYVDPKNTLYFGAKKALSKQLPHDAALHGQSKSAKSAISENKIDMLLEKSEAKGLGQVVSLKYQNKSYNTTLKLPGTYNAYNVVAALLAAAELGVDLDQAVEHVSEITPAFGRAEVVEIDGKQLQILLVKNPAGYNQIISTFLLQQPELPLLMAVNDNIADGRDVSWLWDVDFEQLKGQNHKVVCSGIRGYDLALRLKYADIETATETNLSAALQSFIAELPRGQVGLVIPTYTAMLELRKLLKKVGGVKPMWEK